MKIVAESSGTIITPSGGKLFVGDQRFESEELDGIKADSEFEIKIFKSPVLLEPGDRIEVTWHLRYIEG